MTSASRFKVLLVANLVLVAALIAVGLTAHSLAVFAEGGDYLLDALAIVVALVALRLERGREQRTRRPTTVAALVNAGWLLVLELLVAGGSVDRLATRTPQVDGFPVLVTSGIAAIVMAVGVLVLRPREARSAGSGKEEDLSLRAVLLDTTADAAAAGGVAVAGAVILIVHGWYWLDPAVALVVAAVVATSAARLLRTAAVSARAERAAL
ncbi:MAG: cation diffusion facilitator family transporter [Actinomycetota bacterium]|nr:cation diffusion facilitator family transporter [Actinomycetota bacterium]